jgi:uncharacterized protein YwbE
MRNMRSERWAVVGVLVIVLLGVPVFAFAASMRGGGVDRSTFPGLTETIHVKLDQPSGGVANGTINLGLHGGGSSVFTEVTVTSGDLTSGFVAGTLTETGGPRGIEVCDIDGWIMPGGVGVGSFVVSHVRVPCEEGDIILRGIQLDEGHISFSP